jgi:imidazoleglycerol-phosphate dehydratase
MASDKYAGPASASANPGRSATVARDTAESQVQISLAVDGSGITSIDTGIGFYDHMLAQLGKHAGFDLSVKTTGDLHVDAHHTVEDTALALGSALASALGDKSGVRRFGSVHVPLDEVLVQAAVDLSGRPYVVYEEPPGLAPYVGGTGPLFPTSLARHFWESFGHSARLTLHVVVLRAARPGSQPDAHHVLEAQFKAVARALRDAVRIESTGIPSTKGVL